MPTIGLDSALAKTLTVDTLVNLGTGVRFGFGKDADVSVTVSVNTCDAALDVTTSSFLSSSAEMPSDNVFTIIELTRPCESVVDICVET